MPIERTRSYAAFERKAGPSARESLNKVTIYTGLDEPALEIQQTRMVPFTRFTDFGKSDAEKVVTTLPRKLDDADADVGPATEDRMPTPQLGDTQGKRHPPPTRAPPHLAQRALLFPARSSVSS